MQRLRSPSLKRLSLQAPYAKEMVVLQMRPSCECCNKDLPAEAEGALICSFECTFCAACASSVLGGVCPNCGGGFASRPTRSPAMLVKYPASTERVHKADGCLKLA